MRQFSNVRLIRRNGRLGRGMMYLGLAMTAAAAVLVFIDPNYILVALIVMLVGGLLSQVGTALYNRFGREPRMDQVLDASLKGLDDRYATFHYLLGTDHVLVTPEGIFALIPRLEEGEVNYKDGTWYHMRPKRRLSLRSRERVLRDLEKEALKETQTLEKKLQKELEDGGDIHTEPMIVFIADGTHINADSAPILATHRKKLKNTIRSLEHGKSLDEEEIEQLASELES